MSTKDYDMSFLALSWLDTSWHGLPASVKWSEICPLVSPALLTARAAQDLRANLIDTYGFVSPGWTRCLRSAHDSYSIHFLDAQHRADIWLHRLVVRPFHYVKSALPDPPPPAPSPTIITPAWPAPSFSHLLGLDLFSPFTLSYMTDIPYNVDKDMEDSSAGIFYCSYRLCI
jgi:hypothetical protein